MAKVMMNVQWRGKAPTLNEIQQLFSLTDEEIDKSFGLIEVDPDKHVYTVLVEETSVPKLQSRGDVTVEGPFSNPRIEPFGPPQ
jgi:hypothetical protein